MEDGEVSCGADPARQSPGQPAGAQEPGSPVSVSQVWWQEPPPRSVTGHGCSGRRRQAKHLSAAQADAEEAEVCLLTAPHSQGANPFFKGDQASHLHV